jgi:hypothetical protein
VIQLFDHVPAALFQPLAAQGARLYGAALLTLFEETARQRQPLSRDLAVTVFVGIHAGPEQQKPAR